MPTKEILVEIIEQLDQFEQGNPHLKDYQFNDFLDYLQSNRERSAIHEEDKKYRSSMLSRKIDLVFRYSKEYFKKALSGSKLQTAEEFSFLAVLSGCESMSKTELILKNALPKTSGTEVIKRLLKKGMISQLQDKNDKRSYRVAITAKGRKELQNIFPRMRRVSDILSGNLTGNEKDTLIFLLEKLVNYHRDIFENHAEAALEELG